MSSLRLTNYTFILFLLLCITRENLASDVLGCGGFIKSHAPIDFAKIEVKLYTKQGSLKDSTFCAPNNGYYFLPLYDRGEYYLQINPPTGWSFMPREVHLKIDGSTDLCSQGKDINFIFEGFGITGQVDNFGGGLGPKGVKIQLVGNAHTRETTTDDEGKFCFTPVYPGTHVIIASHPKWKLKNDVYTVQVATENTEIPKSTFVVIGYDVSGSVTFNRQPIANINFILFRNSEEPGLYIDCTEGVPLNYVSTEKPLCYTTSNENGIFSFQTLSPGSYRLVPFYKKDNVQYNMFPEELEFRVLRDSLVLSQTFDMQSFSVSGRILIHADGQSVQGATIFVNDKPVTTSGTDGSFVLEKLKAGTYSVHIEAPGLRFEKKSIKISQNVDLNTDFLPSAFQVCGNVASKNPYTVLFGKLEANTENVDHSAKYRTETTKTTGDFCIYLPQGNYTARVLTGSSGSESDNIQFFPVSQLVQVNNLPVNDVNFSQLKATVSGQVKCLRPKDCSEISIVMGHTSFDGSVHEKEYVTSITDRHFTFTDVVPGTYQVSLAVNKYCWKAAKHIITVNAETIVVPDFIQTGYTIVFLSSHNTQVHYHPIINAQTGEQSKSSKTLQLTRGQNIHCVEHSGLYEFVITSCHMYETSVIKHNTNTDPSEIVLTAIKHMNSVDIKSNQQVGNMTASVTIDGVTTTLGPLRPLTSNQLTKIFHEYYYKITIHLAENEEATLIPHNDKLWFKPSSLKLLGGADCMDHGTRILGIKGRTIQGRVMPPLAGVKITVEEPGNEILVRETDEDGKFKFPTLDDSRSYTVTASKNSYTFTGPDEDGNFKAHKLAEIIVTAVDQKDDSPLQGALISVSGGDSYRSNLQTNANGTIHFTSLSPSDYFLRPMMKEYNFEPNSKIISVAEGATIHIKLSGQRIAYSAYGVVSSLSGEPEDKMVVVANGIGSCSQYSEEATSEANGKFRIRGLHPHCAYEVRVKDGPDGPNQERIERAVPDFLHLQADHQDTSGIKLVALRQTQHMDIVVHVLSSKIEYFRSLRLKLCKENFPNSPIYSIRLDPSLYKSTGTSTPGVLLHLPPLPVDNKSYFIQLESTLSQALHNYKTDIEYFIANTSFKHVVLNFNPQSQVQDHDIGHTSVLALPFLLLVILVAYNMQQISKFLMDIIGKYNLNNFTSALFKKKTSSATRVVDTDEIDQIVQNINVIKRKIRPRKV